MNDSDLGMSEIANMEDQMHDTLRELKERDWEKHLDEFNSLINPDDVERIEVCDRKEFNAYAIDGPIDEAIKYLQDMKEAYPDERLEISVCSNYDGHELELHIWRMETDEEFDERVQVLREKAWRETEQARIHTVKTQRKKKKLRANLVARIEELQGELAEMDARD